MNEFKTIFRRFLGVFIVMVLFAIAEMAPETNAEDTDPLIGKWVGHSQDSAVEHVVRLEGDKSFTWDSNGKLLMSGTWAEDQSHLNLKFGNDDEDVIEYEVFIQEGQLNLKNEEADYTFSKKER